MLILVDMPSRLLKAVVYISGLLLFTVVCFELMLRFLYADPAYYFDYRFSFLSPNAYQNRTSEVWTYLPNANIREVEVYGMLSLFRLGPRFNVEYDCQMKSNNLGFIQDRDVEPKGDWTLILGGSFSSGEGGCPWFERLQAGRPKDLLINAGLPATGFGQWERMLKHLRGQGLHIRRILIIADSSSFVRGSFLWDTGTLNCLDHNVCRPGDAWDTWLPVRLDETQGELLERTRARFSQRYPHFDWKTFVFHYIRQNSYLYKVAMRALETLKAMMGRGPRKSGKILPETTAALVSLQNEKVPVRVLMVTSRDESGFISRSVGTRAAEDALKANHLAFSWCRIPKSDYLPIDGHPTRAGYDKLVECVDAVLHTIQ
jgi:hypothetical protein